MNQLPEFIPYTGGKGYTQTDEGSFFEAMNHKEETINLKVGDKATLFRVVKEMHTDRIMFVTLDVNILAIDEEIMLFNYLFGESVAFKTMILDGYGQDWCYLKQQ